jgi:hypothetical protein
VGINGTVQLDSGRSRTLAGYPPIYKSINSDQLSKADNLILAIHVEILDAGRFR